MTTEQRDIIVLGVALVIYGLVDAWTNGWRPSSIIRLPSLSGEIAKAPAIEYLRIIRDDLVREEHEDAERR
jgi:hypothetical protein